MTQSVSISIEILVGVRHDKEAGVYVSHCPDLNLFSQGEDAAEALKAMEDAIQAYLSVAHKKGMLSKALSKVRKIPIRNQLKRSHERPRKLTTSVPLVPAFA